MKQPVLWLIFTAQMALLTSISLLHWYMIDNNGQCLHQKVAYLKKTVLKTLLALAGLLQFQATTAVLIALLLLDFFVMPQKMNLCFSILEKKNLK